MSMSTKRGCRRWWYEIKSIHTSTFEQNLPRVLILKKIRPILSWGWLRGRITGQAVCRLASQEFPRFQHEKTGSDRRAGCARSRLTTPPRRTGAGRWRQNFPTAVSPKAERPRQDRQGRKTEVTSATTASNQWEIKDPSPRRDLRQRGGDMPSRCRSREKTLDKVSLPEQGQKMTPRTPPPRSRQPAESPPKPVTRPPSI
jgi:hypothetical protein